MQPIAGHADIEMTMSVIKEKRKLSNQTTLLQVVLLPCDSFCDIMFFLKKLPEFDFVKHNKKSRAKTSEQEVLARDLLFRKSNNEKKNTDSRLG